MAKLAKNKPPLLALWGIAFCNCEVQNDACALVSPNMAPNRRRRRQLRRSGQCLFLNTLSRNLCEIFQSKKKETREYENPENYDEKYTVGAQEMPATFRQGPSKSHVTLGLLDKPGTKTPSPPPYHRHFLAFPLYPHMLHYFRIAPYRIMLQKQAFVFLR